MEAIHAAKAHVLFGLSWIGVCGWGDGSLLFDPGESEGVAVFLGRGGLIWEAGAVWPGCSCVLRGFLSTGRLAAGSLS